MLTNKKKTKSGTDKIKGDWHKKKEKGWYVNNMCHSKMLYIAYMEFMFWRRFGFIQCF